MTDLVFALTPAEQQRIARVDELVVLGGEGVPELIQAAADSSWTVRRAVVAGLAALGDEAVPALATWLESARTSEHEIAAIVDALTASLGPTATPTMVALLSHPDAAIAADAATILGRRHATEAASALAAQLVNADDNVAVAAIEALGSLSTTGVPTSVVDPLIAVIETRSFFRTFPALQVLARSGDPRSIQPIAALVGDPLFQREALRALGRSGSVFAVTPLVGALPGAAPEAVRTVAVALADLIARADWSGAGASITTTLGPALRDSLAALAGALDGADPDERAAIATVLGRAGDPRALPVLVALLDHEAVRGIAIAGIQALGRHVPLLSAVDDLDGSAKTLILPLVTSSRDAAHVRALLLDGNAELRARACEALARLGDTSAVPALFDALADPNPRVALAAAGAIQALHSAETTPRVLAALASELPALRRQALRIVAYLGITAAFDPVLAATRDPDRRVAELAIAALGMLADERVDAELERLAASEVAVVRAATMRAWSHRASPRAPELLERALADAEPWVRYYAAQALGKLGHVASVPAILARLSDPMPHVRIAAIEALARVESPAAWQALVSAVGSDDADERRAALVGLGQRVRPEALPLLLEAAHSPDLATRLIAISGLASQPSTGALQEVVRAARDPDPEIRDAALSLLADRDDPDASRALVAVALDTALDHPAHIALSRPSANRIAALVDRLASTSDHTAAILAAALARMADPRATAALFGLLATASSAARGAVASVLVAMNAEGARAAVTRLANDDADPDVRRIAAALVGTNA